FDQVQPPQFLVIHQPPQETSAEILQARENLMESIQTFLKKFNRISFREMPKELADYINTPNWNRPAFYNNDDDDEEYTIAITPVLPTREPDNSLSMGDDHLSTIPEKEEISVENLVPIPSESEGISDSMCDVPLCNNPTPIEAKDHSEIVVDSNDDYSSKVVEIVIPKVGGIDTDILLTIKDDIIREKLLNVNLLIAKIEALKDNPTPSPDFVTSSGSPTSYSDLSLPDYEAFFHDSEPDSGDFTMDVVEVIFDNPTREPRVHVPNVLPTHLTLHLDLNFILSSDSLFAYVIWIFLPFLTYPVTPPYLLSCGNEDTIFDPDISIYHSFMPSVSHQSGTFMKFNVYPNHLNESPMEI
ncbi:hypothetical protein Tco_1513662, partial [Tanacetum coccineum]